MILALVLAGLLQAAPAPPPAEQRSALDLAMEQHLAVVRSERELEFFDRYAKAGPEARARARGVLERLRTPGSASGAPSSSAAVAKALRALDAPPESTSRELQRLQELVDALDLQVTPGIFAAGAQIEGRRVRVAVYPIFPAPERLEVALSLHWTRPDGTPQKGYRGLAKPEVFETQGFAIEIAAPGSQPGIWKLAIEVERDGQIARGIPIEIACVENLGERTRALFDGLEDPTNPRQPLARWIALASQRGLRTLSRARAEEQLARLEGRVREGTPYPWAMSFASEGSEPHWMWRADGPGTTRATLLLACPSSEPAEACLSRAAWAWPGYRVLSTHLPRGAGEEGSVPALFARIEAALALEGHAGEPLVCVARGDAIGRLAMGFYGSTQPAFSADVLSMSDAPASAESLVVRHPRIVFAPGGRTAAGEPIAGSKTWWLDGPSIPLIADFELPLRLGDSIQVLLPPPIESPKHK